MAQRTLSRKRVRVTKTAVRASLRKRVTALEEIRFSNQFYYLSKRFQEFVDEELHRARGTRELLKTKKLSQVLKDF